MVHGETELAKALRASEVLFGKEIEGLSAGDVLDIFADVPSTELEPGKLNAEGVLLSDLLALSGVASSKADAKRLLQSNAVSVNNRRVSDPRAMISKSDFVEEKILVLRKGGRTYHLIKLSEPPAVAGGLRVKG
jgi:tyrosyl-tRNA synthetase